MIPLFKVFIPPMVIEPLSRTLFSGYVGQGPRVEEFEQKLKPWLGTDYILSTITGTAAIHMALRLAGVGPGTSVISTPMTCLATNLPIVNEGAKIIWADINPRTGLIDPNDVEILVNLYDAQAIVCVDWGGTPADLDDLFEIGSNYGIPVIEDACQAFGAEYNGHKVGAVSDFSCISFQAIKTISTVEGGCLTVKTPDDYSAGKLLRWYGIDREQPRRDFRCEQNVDLRGDKWNLSDVNAVIGIEALKYAETLLAGQMERAEYYLREFEARKIKRARPIEYAKGKKSAFWLFTILVDKRDEFIEYMTSRGIATSRVHERNDIHSCFQEFQRDDLPGVDEFVAHEVNIPVHYGITKPDLEYIMDCIQKFDEEGR